MNTKVNTQRSGANTAHRLGIGIETCVLRYVNIVLGILIGILGIGVTGCSPVAKYGVEMPHITDTDSLLRPMYGVPPAVFPEEDAPSPLP